jgi:hypothetical protein
MNKTLALTIIATSLAGVMSASATLYDFSYTDLGGNSGGGTLDVNVNNDVATSGILTVFSGMAQGQWDLITGATGGALYSPAGAFIYDNVVYLRQNPVLDGYGLLFLNHFNPGQELNIWGNSTDNYSFYGANIAGWYNPSYTGPATVGLTGVSFVTDRTVSAVPESGTMVAAALLILPFGVSALRVLRNRRVIEASSKS